MYTHPRLPKYARIILIIVLLWIFFFPSYFLPDFRLLVDYARRRISRSQHSLYILNTTQWKYFDPSKNFFRSRGGSWVDLAGFRHGDGFAWGRLETWRERCWRGSYRWKKKAELEEERWVNVTGVLSGEWVRYIGDLDAKDKASGYLDLWKTAIGVGWAFWDPEDRMMNVKGNEGRVMLRVDEKASLEIEVEQEPDTVEQENELGVILKKGIGRGTALVREVAATLTIQDESTSDEGWEMRVYGVHWPRVGALLMTTTSEKFAGIFGLPHLSLRNDYFATSKRLLIAMIENTLGKAVWFGTRNPWTENSGAKADAWRPVPHCEYVVYVQVASAREGVH